MADLFKQGKPPKKTPSEDYSAKDIEVLEGLEPVRRRPGMYIGGTDENALHHLVSEVFDNAMDEAVAGFADCIEVELHVEGSITIKDNGRGIPIDPHPKFKKKSALEVIMTTLHAGGKFSDKVYHTAGGLHGVGVSVVNALSDRLSVEVVKNKKIYRQIFSRGKAKGPLKEIKAAPRGAKGTMVTFHPDPEIFGEKAAFKPERVYKLACSKAYLFKGVKIIWECAPELLRAEKGVPQQETIHFPNGLQDYLMATLGDRPIFTARPFTGEAELPGGEGRVEWAVTWPEYDNDSFHSSYCNTIPTPEGGTHETGLRTAILRGLRAYGEMTGQTKKLANVTTDDVMGGACSVLSLFIKDPQFQGQTKDKLTNSKVPRLLETVIRDHFDHWLSGDTEMASKLLSSVVERNEERLRRRAQRELSRKTPAQRVRLPGKLADCSRSMQKGTEIFLVEGDSAGGSAKQARDRETQAILPLRGKILNVASATADKILANQEVGDMLLALGVKAGEGYRDEDLRYEKVIIMTDADVDGAHIASLLMTFFYRQIPGLIENGHLYLAQPPLYRITQKADAYYAADDRELAKLTKKLEKKGKIEVGRFKGLGEMTPKQLKETTMNPASRILLQVAIAEEQDRARTSVENLMGRKPELRFRFIQEQTAKRGDDVSELLDL